MAHKLFSLLLLALASAFPAQVFALELPPDTNVRRGVLPNGLSYFIRENRQTPGQADFYLAIRAGSVLEKENQKGLAHFLEHMAFNGTKHFPGGNGETNSVRGWCEKNGIKFGADLNAYTSIDETVFNIANAPVSKPGVGDTCLLILRDWAGDMLLKEEEIDKERGVVHEEWRARRSRFATTRLMEEAMATVYAGSPYADCLPIGHIEVVDTFRYELLRDFYRDWYRPELQAVIVTGDIDCDAIEGEIKNLFSDLNNPPCAPARVYYPVPDNEDMMFYVKADPEQPTLNFSLYMKRDATPRGERSSAEDYEEGYKQTLAMFILRQRLAALNSEGNPRVMSVSARNGSFYVTKEKDAFALTAGLLPSNPSEGVEAAIEVVEKIRRFGVSPAELDHAKIQNALRIEHKLETKPDTRNAEYVKAILDHFLNESPLLDIEDEAAIVARLNEEITVEEINAVLKDLIHDTNQTVLLFGPTDYSGEDYTMPTSEDLKSWIEEAQSREYEPDELAEEADPVFIKTPPAPDKIISKAEAANGYTEYLLSNGIKVSVRPSSLETNRLTINMFRLGGGSMYDDTDADNLRFINRIVRESGASDFDFLTLEKKRKGKALRVVPYIDDEEEGVKGVCAASDLKTWLEVAYLYLTEPRRDEKVFNNILNKQRSLLKNRDANPNVAFNDSLRIAIYGDGRRHQPVTFESLDNINQDRIYEIYKERFADLAGMNLIITGDVREDELEELLCTYVASLPGNIPTISPTKPGPFVDDIIPGSRKVLFTKGLKTPSSLTDIIYSSPLPYSERTDLELTMLAQILKGIFTETIREDKGGSYGVAVEGQLWKYPSEGGSLSVNFRCDPEMYETLVPIVDEQMNIMAAVGPTPEQLAKVKEYEKKNYERAILTNGWWEYVRYHQLKEGVDFNKDFIALLDSVTAEDIRNLCNRLLSAGNRIEVTMTSKR